MLIKVNFFNHSVGLIYDSGRYGGLISVSMHMLDPGFRSAL